MKLRYIFLKRHIGDNSHICIAQFPYKKNFKKSDAIARIVMYLHYKDKDEPALAHDYCIGVTDDIEPKELQAFIKDVASDGWIDYKYWLTDNLD